MTRELANVFTKMKMNNIKQKDLANHIGCSKVWLSYIFNGKRECSEELKSKIKMAVDELSKRG